MMGTSKRKTYTPGYRREAARLAIDTGRTITAVASEIGVGAQLLGRWVQQECTRAGGDVDAPLELDERAELERLRRENQELRMETSSWEKRRGGAVLVLGTRSGRAEEDESIAGITGRWDEDRAAPGGWRVLRPGVAHEGASCRVVGA